MMIKLLTIGFLTFLSSVSFGDDHFQYVDIEELDHEKREQYLRKKNIHNPGSYAYHVINSIPGNVNDSLSSQCKGFLSQDIYGKKKSLYSERVFEASVRADSYAYKSGVNDLLFFHYTRARAMLNDLRGNNPERFNRSFEYLRRASLSYKLWSSMIYVAEDPLSSKSFGNLRVEFTISPSARVLELGYNLDLKQDDPLGIMDELEQKHPGFKKACLNTEQQGWCCGESGIRYLIFEDSGIGLVDYYNPRSDNHNQHFQLITPHVIQAVDLNYGPF